VKKYNNNNNNNNNNNKNNNNHHHIRLLNAVMTQLKRHVENGDEVKRTTINLKSVQWVSL